MKKQIFIDDKYIGTFNAEQTRIIIKGAKDRNNEICINPDYICIFTD